MVKKNRANKIDLSVDPIRLSFLDKVMARSRAYRTGSASDANYSAVSKMIKGSMGQMANSGGVAASMVNKTVAAFNNTLLGIQTNNQAAENNLLALEEKVGGDISQQRFETNLFKRSQLMAESAVSKQAAFSGINSALARGLKTEEPGQKTEREMF